MVKMRPRPCPRCGSGAALCEGGRGDAEPIGSKFYVYVCGASECPMVGPRRDSPGKAVSAWNSLSTETASKKALAAPTHARRVQARVSVIAKPGLEEVRTPKRRITVPPEGRLPAQPGAPAKRGNPAVTASSPSRGLVKRGVGAFIRELIAAGHETERILERVRAEFPGSKATAADVSWNRRKLRQMGERA